MRLNRQKKTLALLLSLVFIVGCQTGSLKTRDQIEKEKTNPYSSGTPLVIDTQPEDPGTTAPIEDKEPPKVGVILSGGGMKSFAHIGVLKSFVAAKVPIHHIVGLEWGAVPAALYSLQGQVHDVEWKMFRLKEDELPSKGFFDSKVEADSIGKLDNFLNTAFGAEVSERAKVSFSCPTYSIKKKRLYWQRKGDFKDIIKRCLPYPPFFKDTQGFIADPFALSDAVAHLKARGSEIIIFVNVAEYGTIIDSKRRKNYLVEYLLWNEVRRQTGGKQKGIDYIISVDTAKKSLFDLSNKRQLVRDGQRAAFDKLMKIGDRYEF